MRKLSSVVAVFLLCAVLFSCGREEDADLTVPSPVPVTAAPRSLEEGKPVPDFHYRLLDDSEGYLSDHIGKPVVLFFWTTQCSPCVSDMPKIQSLYEKYSDKVWFFAVSSGEEMDAVQEYVVDNGIMFPVVFDGKSEIQKLLGIDSLPQSAIIGSGGIVSKRVSGSRSEEEYSELIEDALK